MSQRPADSAPTTRRTFLKTASAAALSASVAPAILGAEDKAGTKKKLVGKGEHTYECHHGWGTLPKYITWGETHGVAIDEEGLVYIKHRSRAKEPIDSIAVFDPQGKFVRSFGKEYHTAGHGIDIRKDGNQEFLYLSCISLGFVVKTDLKGEPVWKIGRPAEPPNYKDPKTRYSPTNLAFAPDGGIYVGDGYGSNYIHKYDKNGKLEFWWGGTGSEPGQMKTPHGIWLDDRPGRKRSLVVADRANARLQYFTLEGKHVGFVQDVSFPADIDIQGEVLLCSDLHARVTLFDKNNKVITHLGYDPEWTKYALDGFKLRRQPENWQEGRFIHPHDACFDRDGNIFVTEWVATGRVSFLRRVS